MPFETLLYHVQGKKMPHYNADFLLPYVYKSDKSFSHLSQVTREISAEISKSRFFITFWPLLILIFVKKQLNGQFFDHPLRNSYEKNKPSKLLSKLKNTVCKF